MITDEVRVYVYVDKEARLSFIQAQLFDLPDYEDEWFVRESPHDVPLSFSDEVTAVRYIANHSENVDLVERMCRLRRATLTPPPCPCVEEPF